MCTQSDLEGDGDQVYAHTEAHIGMYTYTHMNIEDKLIHWALYAPYPGHTAHHDTQHAYMINIIYIHNHAHHLH